MILEKGKIVVGILLVLIGLFSVIGTLPQLNYSSTAFVYSKEVVMLNIIGQALWVISGLLILGSKIILKNIKIQKNYLLAITAIVFLVGTYLAFVDPGYMLIEQFQNS